MCDAFPGQAARNQGGRLGQLDSHLHGVIGRRCTGIASPVERRVVLLHRHRDNDLGS